MSTMFLTTRFMLLITVSVSVSQATTCADVQPPQYGEIIASRGPPYTVGTTLIFKCDRGFKGHGKEEITCLKDGKWSDPVPYCTAYMCQKERDKIEEGRRCRKRCKTDADCNNTFKKCLCDDWCGRSCIYPDLDCPVLKSPKNGYLIGSEMSYGYTVTYGCNEGYILTGTATRRCRSDAKWSGYEPKCVAFSTCGQPGDKDETLFSGKVVEGTDAKVGAWPWQTYLFHSDGHDSGQIYKRKSGFGGGSIIDDKWILTAAHIFEIFPKPFTADVWKQKFLIATGLTVLPEQGQAIPNYVNIFEPQNVYKHSKFDTSSYDYDVALIRVGNRLKKDGNKFIVDTSAQHNVFTFSRHIRPVCLPCIKGDPFSSVNIWKDFDADTCNVDKRGRLNTPSIILAGISVMVTGFGKKRHEGESISFQPKKLQEGLLKIFDELKCVESVKKIQQLEKEARFTDRMLCAGSADETKKVDSCQGDSGGPLVKQYNRTERTKFWTQIGIVSWGWGCGNEYPGYYTDVTSVMAWVWKVIDDTRIGTWHNWSLWSKCSKTCGSGERHRYRVCAEKNCQGPSREVLDCSTQKCPTGIQCSPIRSLSNGKVVVSPHPNLFHVGTTVKFYCDDGTFMKTGNSSMTCLASRKWSEKYYPSCVDEWTDWSTWSSCTATCSGARYKTRNCKRGNDIFTKALGCKGDTILYTKKGCNAATCPSATKGCQGGGVCLQGDISVDSSNILPHLSNLLSSFGGKK